MVLPNAARSCLCDQVFVPKSTRLSRSCFPSGRCQQCSSILKTRISPARLIPPLQTSAAGQMAPAPGPFPPPTGPFPPLSNQDLRNALGHIPPDGITTDDLLNILFSKGTVPEYVKQGVIKGLDPIASLDAATGLWKPRPRYPEKPGYLYQMISRPRKRKRVSPFSSQWISETGETITHVRGNYKPVWQRYPVRGFNTQDLNCCYRDVCVQVLLHSSPALFAFLHIHTTVTKCSTRDCLTCSLADLAAESMKPLTFTIDRVLHFFYDVCEKVFWGPRARAKRRVGPLANLHGDRDHTFLLFLLYNMREQLVRYPRCVPYRQAVQGCANSITVISKNLNGFLCWKKIAL